VCVLHSVELHCVCIAQSRGALCVFTAQFREARFVFCTVYSVIVCELHIVERYCL